MSISGDIRHSIRVFKNNPGYAVLIVVMLALGIGSCTAIFTAVNAVLLKPLPYPESERLVELQEISDRGTPMRVPEGNFVDWQKASHSFEAMAMFSPYNSIVRAGNRADRVLLTIVSKDFFDILKIQPLIGSGLLSDHFRPDAPPVLLLSYRFWKRAFGGSPDVSNMRIELEGRQYSISGVMPPQFNFPESADVWAPRTDVFGNFNPSRSSHNWYVLARLGQGVTVNAASQEVAAIAKSIHDSYSDVTAVSAAATPLQHYMTQSVRTVLPVLLASVGILLLVACANTMNLTLSHIASRERELAVRTALGAGQIVLIRLFLSQTLLLAGFGGILGAAIAVAGVPALLALRSDNLPRMAEVHTDWRVLLFALIISVATGVILGIVPAMRIRNANLDETLKQGGRSQSSAVGARRIRRALVIAQVGMTVVLLVAAALLGRGFVNLLQVNLGFQTENRIDIETIFLVPPGETAKKTIVLKTQQILDRIRTTPGVLTAAAVNGLPLAGYNRNGRFTLDDGSTSGAYWPVYNATTLGYFEAVGIPLVRGRFFSDTDGPDSPQVAVISQTVANLVWPGRDPIGRRINFGNMDGDYHDITIVGVAGDVRNDPAEALQGTIYVNLLQRGARRNFDFVVRGTGDGDTLGRAIAAEIRKADPDASVRVKTFDQMFSTRLADRRFNLVLLGAFGGTALVLALMGIYAVASYSVSQRTQEIGIRMALGADGGDVSRLFLSEGAWLVFAGITLGIFGAVAASQVLKTFLFNVRPTDSLAYVLAITAMGLTALIANILPARRAARTNPAVTLQQR